MQNRTNQATFIYRDKTSNFRENFYEMTYWYFNDDANFVALSTIDYHAECANPDEGHYICPVNVSYLMLEHWEVYEKLRDAALRHRQSMEVVCSSF